MTEGLSLAVEVGVPIVATVVLSVCGALIGRLLKKVDDLQTQNDDQNKTIEKMEHEIMQELHNLDVASSKQIAALELRVQKDFVSQPAMLQIMTSLDKTLTALSEVIKSNQKETNDRLKALAEEHRENLNALNARIDGALRSGK